MGDKARFTFAFMADVQELAKQKHIRVASFINHERKSAKGSYDYLTVSFIVPRPDRDKEEQHNEIV